MAPHMAEEGTDLQATRIADITIHPTAEVAASATIGRGTRIWHFVQVREDARIGSECILGKNVYIDHAVTIGDRVKIQNNVSVFHGVTIEDGVFVGPHVCFTNDLLPRAIAPDGTLKGADDWTVGPILVRRGASLGAASVILPSVTIGAFALVGAGSVVTRSVPEQGLVYGNPARLHGYVCRCGRALEQLVTTADAVTGLCPACDTHYTLGAPPS